MHDTKYEDKKRTGRCEQVRGRNWTDHSGVPDGHWTIFTYLTGHVLTEQCTIHYIVLFNVKCPPQGSTWNNNKNLTNENFEI